jgi:hypothetical protein
VYNHCNIVCYSKYKKILNTSCMKQASSALCVDVNMFCAVVCDKSLLLLVIYKLSLPPSCH